MVLDRLSYTDAASRTRMVLQGMRLADIARADVMSLLGFIGKAQAEYERAFRRIEELYRAGIFEGVGPLSPDNAAVLALRNTLDILIVHEERVQSISKEYYALLYSFSKKMDLFIRVSGEPSVHLNSVLADVKKAQAPVDVLMERYVFNYNQLQDLWNGWFPNDQRRHVPFERL
jgi:hypothetical protein